MMENNVFETERLFLRPAAIIDAEFFLKLYNTPKFVKFIGDRNLRTIADAENYITEKFMPQIEKMGFGNYVVIDKITNEKLGAVGIFVREGLEIPDIGFSFLPEFEGKGFAYESADFVKNMAWNSFNFTKLSAITTKENVSSQKLIEKLGGKFQKMVTIPGDDVELLYYEIEKN